jgi:hypothetical protein
MAYAGQTISNPVTGEQMYSRANWIGQEGPARTHHRCLSSQITQ